MLKAEFKKGRAVLAVVSCSLVAVAIAVPAAKAADPAPWVYFQHATTASCAGSEIWRARIDGKHRQRVLPGTFDVEPGSFDVSSNGRLIVRTVETSSGKHLFLYDLSTGAVRRLTSGRFLDYRPAFSPDGKQIAFLRTTYGPGGGALYVLRLGNRPRLKKVFPSVEYGEPSWSPNGRRIAIITGGAKAKGIVTVNPRTRSVRQFVPRTLRRHYPYFPIAYEVSWTRRGLFYSATIAWDPDLGATRRGLPPAGVYLTRKPVEVTGRLIYRSRYPSAIPERGGEVAGAELLPGKNAVVADHNGKIVRVNLRSLKIVPLKLPPNSHFARLAAAPPIGGKPFRTPAGVHEPPRPCWGE